MLFWVALNLPDANGGNPISGPVSEYVLNQNDVPAGYLVNPTKGGRANDFLDFLSLKKTDMLDIFQNLAGSGDSQLVSWSAKYRNRAAATAAFSQLAGDVLCGRQVERNVNSGCDAAAQALSPPLQRPSVASVAGRAVEAAWLHDNILSYLSESPGSEEDIRKLAHTQDANIK